MSFFYKLVMLLAGVAGVIALLYAIYCRKHLYFLIGIIILLVLVGIAFWKSEGQRELDSAPPEIEGQAPGAVDTSPTDLSTAPATEIPDSPLAPEKAKTIEEGPAKDQPGAPPDYLKPDGEISPTCGPLRSGDDPLRDHGTVSRKVGGQGGIMRQPFSLHLIAVNSDGVRISVDKSGIREGYDIQPCKPFKIPRNDRGDYAVLMLVRYNPGQQTAHFEIANHR